MQEYDISYLQLLAEKYPSIPAASHEIVRLSSLLQLPKETEHFLSDVHGEYEAFSHVIRNGAGSIRRKIGELFANSLTRQEQQSLATLIYYPEEKSTLLLQDAPDPAEWSRLTLVRLIRLCRVLTSKYRRESVRELLPAPAAPIVEELLEEQEHVANKEAYYRELLDTIVTTGSAQSFIIYLAELIQRLAIARLHVIGDIYDRGPGAHLILDALMKHRHVDIQWGNHDILWMGAAAGSEACIANVVRTCLRYGNMETLENGYGVSLLPLASFAIETYGDDPCAVFIPKVSKDSSFTSQEIRLMAQMQKAIAIIQFKLEGQTILRNPSFGMDDRLLLDKIDFEKKTVRLPAGEYPLRDCDFPTIDPADPYRLSPEEHALMAQLKNSFLRSEKLQRHISFLYSKGGLYKCFNGNLLFHGCIPMDDKGGFLKFSFGGQELSGKALMDWCETVAREGYYAREGTPERQFGKEFLWFLWCGRNSPSFGRDHIATFERRLIADQSTWAEPKNPYYSFYNDSEVCVRILREFGLEGEHCHIVNGHVPVKSKDGESPIKAGGRLIVIDGGFCRAYQPTTGIAGYTLVYDSWGIHITAHEPFPGKETAIRDNKDILSTSMAFDRSENRIRIRETDTGHALQQTIDDLKELLAAFRRGEIKEDNSDNTAVRGPVS